MWLTEFKKKWHEAKKAKFEAEKAKVESFNSQGKIVQITPFLVWWEGINIKEATI